MAHINTELPFDNLGYRTIIFDFSSWDGWVRARSDLSAAVEAISDAGYIVSNPVTHAIGVLRLKETADPQEEMLLALVEEVSAVRRSVHQVQQEVNSLRGGVFSHELGRALLAPSSGGSLGFPQGPGSSSGLGRAFLAPPVTEEMLQKSLGELLSRSGEGSRGPPWAASETPSDDGPNAES